MSITHNDECYKIHFACAIAEVERLRAELEKTPPVTRPMISAAHRVTEGTGFIISWQTLEKIYAAMHEARTRK